MSATATRDADSLRAELDSLNWQSVLQEENPGRDIFTAEMEDRANTIGVELMEIKADEAEKLKKQLPQSPEVEAHAYWQRRHASEAREQLPTFRRSIATDKPIVLPSPAPPAKGQASARESHGSSTPARGSRRGSASSSRSDSSSGDSDLSDPDEPGEAGSQEQVRCAGCGGAVPAYTGRGRRSKYCRGTACKKARAAARQRTHRIRTTTLPPATVDLADKVAGRRIPINPKRISFSAECARIFGTCGDDQAIDDHHVAEREGKLDLRRESVGRRSVELLDSAATLWIAGDTASAFDKTMQLLRSGMPWQVAA